MWVPVSQRKSASWKIPRLYRVYTPKINWKSEWEAPSSLLFWHFFFKVRLAFCLFQFFFALWVSVCVCVFSAQFVARNALCLRFFTLLGRVSDVVAISLSRYLSLEYARTRVECVCNKNTVMCNIKYLEKNKIHNRKSSQMKVRHTHTCRERDAKWHSFRFSWCLWQHDRRAETIKWHTMAMLWLFGISER